MASLASSAVRARAASRFVWQTQRLVASARRGCALRKGGRTSTVSDIIERAKMPRAPEKDRGRCCSCVLHGVQQRFLRAQIVSGCRRRVDGRRSCQHGVPVRVCPQFPPLSWRAVRNKGSICSTSAGRVSVGVCPGSVWLPRVPRMSRSVVAAHAGRFAWQVERLGWAAPPLGADRWPSY